jgi:hypothetical protein
MCLVYIGALGKWGEGRVDFWHKYEEHEPMSSKGSKPLLGTALRLEFLSPTYRILDYYHGDKISCRLFIDVTFSDLKSFWLCYVYKSEGSPTIYYISICKYTYIYVWMCIYAHIHINVCKYVCVWMYKCLGWPINYIEIMLTHDIALNSSDSSPTQIKENLWFHSSTP